MPPDGWEKQEYRLTTQSYTAAIRAFCQAMELDRPVVMGCSIGGRIVLAAIWRRNLRNLRRIVEATA